MSNYKFVSGINIQWPWSELLLSGKKIVETRSYPLPKKFHGVELAVIETPGPKGKKEAGISEARIIGIIVFERSYLYTSKTHWLKEQDFHLVKTADKLYSFNNEKPKWAWIVQSYIKFHDKIDPPLKRGIIFANNCRIPKV